MKALNLKVNSIIILLLLISAIFCSCKKTSINEVSKTLAINQNKIQAWLASQKKDNSIKNQKWVDTLNKHLLYDKMWSEKKDDLLFLVVPVDDALKFKNNKGQRISSYFVSAVNTESKIIYSLIVQNKPANHQNSTDLTEGAITDIINNKFINADCNVTFITIFDNFLYTKNYKNYQYISTSNLSKKINNNSKNISNNRINGCIDWYWVTTYADGSQTWEYAYTSCPDDSCYDIDYASICPDEGGGGGGGLDPQPLPTDPCADAQMGSTHATNLSQNGSFTSAKTNIITAASNGNEHGITFGRDAYGNITTSNITNGTGNSGTVPNWPGAFADLHNHNNSTPPSSGDLYGFIDRSNVNSFFETRYILTSNGTVYALTITNLQQANNFNINYPRIPNPGFEPDFPTPILDEINMLKGFYGATDEMAMAFVMEKYHMGVALLKQDNNGSFKRINTVENTNASGTPISYTSNNCQ